MEEIKDHSISGEYFHLNTCQTCGFVFTQGAPDELTCGRYYQSEDYISHSNTAKGVIFKLYHLVRNIMLAKKYQLIHDLNAPKRLLDVGSGTGYFLDYMNSRGYRVEGIEVDDKARSFSKEHFGVDVHSPDYLKEVDMSQKFGYITLWHVLEHLYEPNDYFHIFHSILSDDGYLVIAVPNKSSFDATYYGTYWAAYDVPRHLWHFTPETLEKLALNNHFKLLKKKSMPFDPFYNAILSEKYKGSSLGFLRGMVIGFISFIKGMLNVNKSSSLIYVFIKAT
ncbi:MAG: class I SAM-dependent methyltransferase [Saprospiraceae bacterium]|nr:class I SAM-dependent methyltransferase [Saprospiraceae bacterium]